MLHAIRTSCLHLLTALGAGAFLLGLCAPSGPLEYRLLEHRKKIVDHIDSIVAISETTNQAGNADDPCVGTSTSNPYIDPNDADGYGYAWYVAFGYAADTDGERYYNCVRLLRNAEL